ncbi:DUF4838 domain-containing protein [Paenibacillus eucommiae]|uniref:SLH domain-containing protein n=1 Tax=Paenibacillus eucommiae TaxID=1355755 RepID=A0ABS4IRG7_9BACL|nr:DUF4838 domain-containing protein [Paenibacillus eucommiae]MBP1990152.1 hypothetical protein [Paenibacillus eucommiae]
MRLKKRAQLSILLIICLLGLSFNSFVSPVSTASAANVDADSSTVSSASKSVSDIKGHWAEASIQKWLDSGWVSGYANGKFEPNRNVTRGEMLALINRSFGFEEKAEVHFEDLSIKDWEHDDVAKAIQAGYVEGYENNTIRSKSIVNREEAAVMIARVLHIGDQTAEVNASAFTDESKLSVWSKASIHALVSQSVINGYPDGSFRPAAALTRAETVAMLERALTAAKLTQATKYDEPGVYGTADKVTTINGDVVISKPGVVLDNYVILGDLTLAAGIGEGEVSLRRVSVKGNTNVQGGGVNSIHLVDSTLLHVIIDKKAGSVRVVAEGTTSVERVTLLSAAILEETDLTGQGFIKVLFSDKLAVNSLITLIGEFNDVQIDSRNSEVHLQKGSLIHKLILNAVAKFLGQGTIQTAEIREAAKGSTFERQPENHKSSGTAVGTLTNNPGSNPPDPDSLTIVGSNQPNAVVLVSPGASTQIQDAAQLLVSYIEKSTGVQLAVYTVGDTNIPSGGTRVYIDSIAPGSEADVNGLLQNLDEDGFVIFPKLASNSISIIGPTSWGTEYGVDEFLERYVGVRWLLPGPDGEDVPQVSTLVVAPGSVREEPAFISRKFFGIETVATNVEWSRRNRMNDKIHFHHNLSSLFDPQVFANHPEYYPGGVVPASIHGWQPCMNEVTAEAAIERIKAYFLQHPDEISYSLGINDNSNFCEANPANASYPNPPLLNSVGYLDMSNVYYAWVNAIVEGVLEDYPDKYFGLLAYWNVFDPPTAVTLNSRVIPYITDDRMSWTDPVKGAAGHQQTDLWQEKATNLAFYEYLYGFPYSVPRVYFHRMAENYAYSETNGVIAHVAELFPNFGEGPKPWLSAKLQWDPNQDVDALLNEWYVRAVGEEAAPYLKSYYDHWEQFWTDRIFSSEWYLNWADSPNRNNFMNLYDYSYLAEVTDEDLSLSRSLMEQVVQHAQTDEQVTRAGLLLRAFEYYEASSLGYMRKSKIDAPASLAEALDMVTELSIAMEMADKQTALNLESKSDPILYLTSNPIKGTFGWNGTQPGLLSSLLQWLKTAPSGEAESFKTQLAAMAQEAEQPAEHPYLKSYALLLLSIINDAPNLVKNPSFELGEAGNPEEAWKWSHWQNEAGSFKRSSAVSYSGGYSIEASGVSPVGGLAQNVPLTNPGKYGALIRFYVPEDSETKGTVQWYINLRDSNNNIVDSVITVYMPANANKGKWVTMEAIFNVPASAVTAEYGAPIWSYGPGDKLYMDDMALYWLDPSAVEPVQVTSVAAQQGTIEVVFDRPLNAEPALADFSIVQQQQTINDGKTALSSVKEISPTAVSWDEATRTAVLTIPDPYAAFLEQSIIYSVSYQNRTAVSSNPLSLAGAANLTNLVQNASFEDGDAPWWYWKEGAGTLSRSSSVFKTGSHSLELDGVSFVGGPIQTMTVEPGLYEAVVYYYTPPGSATGASIQWGMNLRDSNNVITSSVITQKENVAASNGTWKMIETMFEVTAPTNQVQLIFPVWDLQPGEKVYLDDVALYRLDAPVVEQVEIESVEAQQGTVDVVFKHAPAEAPELSSFAVKQRINNGAAIVVTPTAVSWDEAARIATLTIPSHYAAYVEQNIVYSVSYESGAYIESSPYLVAAAENLVNLLQNGSFEAGDAPWWYWKEGPNGTMSRSDLVTRTDDYSLELNGVSSVGGPVQTVVVDPGFYEAVVYYYTPPGLVSGATMQWGMNLRDQGGVIVSSVVTDKERVDSSNGSWKMMEIVFEVKEPVNQVQLIFPAWDLQAGEKLYIDDVALYKLSGVQVN